MTLTEREVRVLRLVADGYANVDIARQMNVSPHTVKNTIHDLMNRLHLRNRTHAAAFAVRAGLV
ncbi:response regulator transcription factor [Actinophytocola sp.]|uniref:response regulator transcription factor n=1 Tax=Actinophytocola sp. TaxID=1872138 RepID=UPI00389A08A7